jgi:hypothetical protein
MDSDSAKDNIALVRQIRSNATIARVPDSSPHARNGHRFRPSRGAALALSAHESIGLDRIESAPILLTKADDTGAILWVLAPGLHASTHDLQLVAEFGHTIESGPIRKSTSHKLASNVGRPSGAASKITE